MCCGEDDKYNYSTFTFKHRGVKTFLEKKNPITVMYGHILKLVGYVEVVDLFLV
jgi:hypothetical protein